MNNAVNSIWEWSQVFPLFTTHPLAMCMVVACIAMRREDGVNHFFTVIFTPASGVHTWHTRALTNEPQMNLQMTPTTHMTPT